MAERTLAQINEWPPVLPVFGQITPFPATPLYDRLESEGRLTRAEHWLEFAPFQMAHTPLRITVPQVQAEVRYAWMNSYSPDATERALESIENEPAAYKISHWLPDCSSAESISRRKGAWQWLKLMAENRRSLWGVVRDSFTRWHGSQDGTPGKTSTAVHESLTETSAGLTRYGAQPTQGDPETDPQLEI